MKSYEKLYFLRNNKKVVQEYLGNFLLFQIYSVPVIRYSYPDWPAVRWYLRQNTPDEIQNLIEKSPYLSNEVLQEKLNEYHIRQAVRVLAAYQSCDTPITQDPSVSKNRYKLTTKHGDKALTLLQKALQEKKFSDEMADLAVRTSHKFLAEDKYYLRWRFSKKYASLLAIPATEEGDTEESWIFPAIQLTRGCLNHCSHCDSRAEPHLSHMPWPLFRGLYRNFNEYYRHYRQEKLDCHFSTFFADSDMLDYYDPIMNVDAGDVGLWIEPEGGSCQYLTRGIKNERNKLALAKALISENPFALSFVDTPKENMSHNLKQLNDTLDVIESVWNRSINPFILHLHLKSGPTVSKKIFRDFPLEQKVIRAMGRAKDLPADEVEPVVWPLAVIPKFIFRPNGDLEYQEDKNGDLYCSKGPNILSYQYGPQISRTRLFLRRHILSYFR